MKGVLQMKRMILSVGADGGTWQRRAFKSIMLE